MSQTETTTQSCNNERTTGLGGHDIGAICGVHPFLTSLDVYNEKVNGMSHFEPEYIQRRGLYLEKFLIWEYQKNISPAKDFSIEMNAGTMGGFYRHAQYPFFYAHPDYVMIDSPVTSQKISRVIECKSPAIIGKEWGEEGTFEVPDYIKCQAAWYRMVTDCEQVDIVVDSPFKIKVYTYIKDADLEDLLLNAGLDFWNNNVLKKIPPEAQTIQDAGELYRKSNPDTAIEANEELAAMIFRIKELQGHIKTFDKEIENLKLQVQKKMQENETVSLQGVELATWKPCSVTRFDAKAFKEDEPELYEDYMSTATSRRFLVK